MRMHLGGLQVCAAVGLCQAAARNGVSANATTEGTNTARKLLAGGKAVGGAGGLGDPSPFCQFCTVAISYIKARLRPPSELSLQSRARVELVL